MRGAMSRPCFGSGRLCSYIQGTAWINRTLSVSYARLGDRLAALASIEALRRYSPDLTIDKIVSSVPFTQDFLNRVAEGLDGLGMPT